VPNPRGGWVTTCCLTKTLFIVVWLPLLPPAGAPDSSLHSAPEVKAILTIFRPRKSRPSGRILLACRAAKSVREVFAEESRCRHREHLFRRIAWRLQALAEGDLTERARERASQIARDADLRMVAPRGFFLVEGEPVRTTRGAGNRRPADDRLPLPGTLLSRQWKGRTLLVEVLADGFRFENRHYTSLSAIAVAITGTRWNGLAFFRLTGKGRKEQRHAAE
jgi:hypothetical protein